MIRTNYVRTIRAVRGFADMLGLLRALEMRSSASRTATWARSLFAIYDIDDMIAIDLPWWTLGAVEEADQFLRSRPGARVFEYGSGASSVWLARRAGSLTTIEHDPEWHAKVAVKLLLFKNAEARLIEADPVSSTVAGYVSSKRGWKGRSFRNYAEAINTEEGMFDMIVIDGRARPACLRHAERKLRNGGIIVFDNSHRRAYCEAIRASDLHALRIRGIAACLPYPDETTLLMHRLQNAS